MLQELVDEQTNNKSHENIQKNQKAFPKIPTVKQLSIPHVNNILDFIIKQRKLPVCEERINQVYKIIYA